MGRRLQGLGVLLIAVTAGLWVAEVAGVIGRSTDDRWWGLTLKAGLIAVAVGTLLRVLAPIAGALTKGRCTVCGRSTERGHAYCLDHLQQTVHSARDEARDRKIPRQKPVRPVGR
jgi:hypothetical protein